MQVVKKILITSLLTWFAILLFMPKQELYFKLEETLEKNNIKINEERIDEGIFSLNLHNVDIFVKGIKLATAEEVSFFTLLFYTKAKFEKLLLDKSLGSMAPTDIDEATLSYGIWAPRSIGIEAEGSFGLAEGNVALGDNSVRVDFNESVGIEKFKSKLKKDEKGWYYEASF